MWFDEKSKEYWLIYLTVKEIEYYQQNRNLSKILIMSPKNDRVTTILSISISVLQNIYVSLQSTTFSSVWFWTLYKWNWTVPISSAIWFFSSNFIVPIFTMLMWIVSSLIFAAVLYHIYEYVKIKQILLLKSATINLVHVSGVVLYNFQTQIIHWPGLYTRNYVKP